MPGSTIRPAFSTGVSSTPRSSTPLRPLSPFTVPFSYHLLLLSLLISPVYAMTGNLVLCYNLLLLLSLAGSGLAMHAFIRSVTGSNAAAFVAGLAWACWPYRTAHLLHLQLQSLYFLPLALLALHRVAAARK